MSKTVFTFGLIAGAVLSAMMLISLPFHDAIGFEKAEVLGYTTMVVAFLLVYFGVRSYRDNVGNGTVRFGRAFGVGISIVVIASLCYVATWLVAGSRMAPDYMAKYQTHIIEKARADGESEAQIAARQAEMQEFAKMAENPAVMAAFTFIEPLPVGLIISLVSAGVLSRRKKQGVEIA
jgi:hypothetical protein